MGDERKQSRQGRLGFAQTSPEGPAAGSHRSAARALLSRATRPRAVVASYEEPGTFWKGIACLASNFHWPPCFCQTMKTPTRVD